jgi:hypothetical protein
MRETDVPDDPQVLAPDDPSAEFPAWEQLAPGRFMPRRIRGSYRGAKLG